MALVVIGSGPGIGVNVATLFAERGFKHIILMSRNASRLEEDKAFVQKAASSANVETIPIDLADTQNVQKALSEVDQKLQGRSLECVLFNAARVGLSKFFEWKPEDLETDLRVSVLFLLQSNQKDSCVLK